MSNWLRSLLKKQLADAAASDESVQPRIRDADGLQLAQVRNVVCDELEWLAESAHDAQADLSIESTAKRRSARARTRTRKPR